MQLSPHFTLAEFTISQIAERKGLDNLPDPAHLEKLRKLAWHMEEVRTALGAPIIVSSAYRSPHVNAAVGGSKTSSHVQAEAVDFICPGFGKNRDIIERLRGMGSFTFDQLILEFPKSPSGGWVHIGFRLAMRRQVMQYDGKSYTNI